ncbi:MAG: BlaI/MecI/CopY family transcriptional regulator [Candidatus Brocadiia bacterium]
MGNGRPDRLTPLESLIMDCVWDMGEATVREVKERLDPEKPMAYTTVQKMMSILRDKGFLASRREGRADVYRPLVERERMGRDRLREIMDLFFSGSAAALVSNLIESDEVSEAEIEAMREVVEAKAGGDDDCGGD